MDTSLSELQAWTGRSETCARSDRRDPGQGAQCDARPSGDGGRRRNAAAAPVALAVFPAAAPAVARSARTATPSAAASCRRCRCRGACGRAASSSSARRCASAMRSTRTSTIDDVTTKDGRTGKLVFVKVRHEVRCNGCDGARRSSSSTTSSTASAKRPGDVGAAARSAADDRRGLAARDRARRRAAVPLLGAHLQRPPHPLRPQVRHRSRGLPRPDRARPADRHAADGSAAPAAARRPMCATFRFKAVRPTFDLNPFRVNGQPAGRRQDDPPVGPGP